MNTAPIIQTPETIRKITMNPTTVEFTTLRISPNPDGKHLTLEVIPHQDVSNPDYVRNELMPITRNVFLNGSRSGKTRPEATLPNQLHCTQGICAFLESCADKFEQDREQVDLETASLASHLIDELISLHLPRLNQNLHSFMLQLDQMVERSTRKRTHVDSEDLDSMEVPPPPGPMEQGATPMRSAEAAGEPSEIAPATPPSPESLASAPATPPVHAIPTPPKPLSRLSPSLQARLAQVRTAPTSGTAVRPQG